MTQQSQLDSELFMADARAAGEPARAAAGGHTDVGASLRSLREARHWTVADVSARLKFAPKQIEALEADQWDRLPQGPSLRGLVRNYARLLDQDPEILMRAIPAHLQHQPPRSAGSFNGMARGEPLPRSRRNGSRRWLAGLFWLVVVCVLALAAYLIVVWWLPRVGEGRSEPAGNELGLSSFGMGAASPGATGQIVLPPATAIPPVTPAPGTPAAPTAPAIPPVASAPQTPADVPAAGGLPAPAGTIPAPAGTVPGAAEPAPAGAAGTAAGAAGPEQPAAPAQPEPAAEALVSNQVGLEVKAASWVEVRDAGGAVVLSATLQPGARQEVEAKPPVRLVIGNANGVALSWRGVPVDLAAHQRGNVARLTLE